LRAYRAAVFHLLGDPAVLGDPPVLGDPELDAAPAWAYFPDGLLVIEDGKVAACGAHADLAPGLGDTPIEALPGRLITPGFIDLHVHLPQTRAIAAHGEQLLDWLERHIFPAEAAFADPDHAVEAARFFIAELLRNGTTTALVFGSSHKTSVEALFTEALARDMRLIAGKVLMDRNAPPGLCDTVEDGRRETLELIETWSGRGRLGYAVTPRFAITSSDAQLAMAGEILATHPDVWMQTHLAENPAEIALTAALFPEADDYLDVYRRHGLVGPRSVFAHCIHLDDAGFETMARAGAAAAFCPSSNLFLGSGLFNLKRAGAHGLKIGMGTDVGAGTSYSLLHTLGEAYKVGQLRGDVLDPFQAFYLATLGGARALNLDHKIGNFEPGKEADFVVLDPAATPLLAHRLAGRDDLAERLFALTILGDDRVVERTYVAGVLQHAR
jgi:guanine deaminase